MNGLYTINTQDTIGNSLSSVNINYYNLELATLNLKTSAEKLWNPMLNYYLDVNKFLKETTSICQKNSSILISMATTVESNSAGWTKPITIFYPSLFPDNYPLDTVVATVSSWLISYLPVIDPVKYILDETTGNEIPVPPTTTNYIEGQTAIIYAHTWSYGDNISENQFINDFTLCSTQDKSICSYCIDRYYGYVYCSNGDFSCNGHSTSCQSCGSLHCYYQNPPYNAYVPPVSYVWRTDVHTAVVPEVVYVKRLGGFFGRFITKIKKTILKTIRWTTRTLVAYNPLPSNQLSYGSISANVEMTFQDRHESETITGLVFKVQNCNWVFSEKYIT
jgi:hypothetical protein